MNPANQAQRGPYVKTSNLTTVYRLRCALKLTQPDAAKRSGVGLRTFQRAESGDVINRATLRTIERALGLLW